MYDPSHKRNITASMPFTTTTPIPACKPGVATGPGQRKVRTKKKRRNWKRKPEISNKQDDAEKKPERLEEWSMNISCRRRRKPRSTFTCSSTPSRKNSRTLPETPPTPTPRQSESDRKRQVQRRFENRGQWVRRGQELLDLNGTSPSVTVVGSRLPTATFRTERICKWTKQTRTGASTFGSEVNRELTSSTNGRTLP